MATTAEQAARDQSPMEERANAIAHGIGLLLSLVCLAFGILYALSRHNPWMITSVAIHGTSLCLLFLSSTCYHSAHSLRARHIWNVLDHSFIYLLIAGTSTPYTLGPLRNYSTAWGFGMFGVIWGLSVAGIVFQSLYIHRWRNYSTLAYVLLGWVIVVAIRPLWIAIGIRGLSWIALGCLCYMLGVLFYTRKHVSYMHFVWHLFVLAGSMIHFLGVMFTIVLP